MSALLLFIAAQSFAITDVTVIAGDGTAELNATVVVRNGKIASVSKAAAPSGLEVISGTGKVVTPGLIEVLSSIGVNEVGLEPHTNDHNSGGKEAPGFRVADGINPASQHVAIVREQGITTVQVQPSGGLIAGQTALMDLTGALDSVFNPSAMMRVTIPAAGEKTTRGQRWLRVREILDDARFYKKNRSAYERAGARALSLSRVHLEALLPVIAGKQTLLARANRASDLVALSTFSREEKIPLVVVGGREAYLASDALKAAKIPVIMQPSMQHIEFDSLHARDDLATALDEQGVELVISAGVEWGQARRLRHEAGHAVARGLPYQSAIKAITSTPAKVLGLKDRGVLKKGARADLVLWSGDPLELSTMAERLWIAGEAQDLNTRQFDLARKYLK